jgi:GntR family transcriptional regulator, transcriptional repressor for pyruvate dehydrogenase complex
MSSGAGKVAPVVTKSSDTAASLDGTRQLEVRRIQSSYMQVADQLRDLISRGDLIVGQRLPPEAEMAPLFGVSRSTIREALRILVTDGLVVTRRGVHGGTFVAELDHARVEGVLSDAFNLLALTNKVKAADFLEAWQAIDVPAARLAARRREDEHVAELDRLSAPASPTTPRAARLQQSSDFHFAVLGASGNLLLEAMGRPVSAVARSRFSRTAPNESFWDTNTAEHRRIYEAIAAGDEEAAAREAAHHIVSLKKYYRDDES